VFTLSQVSFPYFLKRAEKNHKQPHSGQSVSQSRQKKTNFFQIKSEVLVLEPTCVSRHLLILGIVLITNYRMFLLIINKVLRILVNVTRSTMIFILL
jgi:hypothetical protein